MKNIETILKEAGVELTEDQTKQINDGVKENYKTVNDWQKQVDKATSLQTSLDETKATLVEAQETIKKYDGVDTEALNKQIADLQKTIQDNEAGFQAKLADRDFEDLVKTAISNAKGKNTKAITALLDLGDLKASKNQKEDLEKAIQALVEAEDSKMLFGEPEPKKLGEGNLIGTVAKGSGAGAEVDKARAIMGLPPMNKQ